MKTNTFAAITFFCATSLGGAVVSAAFLPYGQQVPPQADGAPIVVQAKEKSLLKSGVGIYWIPGGSFRVAAPKEWAATNRSSMVAGALLGVVGTLAVIVDANASAADKIPSGSSTRLIDLDAAMERALQREFSQTPRKVSRAGDSRRVEGAIMVSATGTFEMVDDRNAKLNFGAEATFFDASGQMVWRDFYEFLPDASMELSETGWLKPGAESVAAAADYALSRMATLIRRELEGRLSGKEILAKADSTCGLLRGRKVTVLEADASMVSVRFQLSPQNGAPMRIISAEKAKECIPAD